MKKHGRPFFILHIAALLLAVGVCFQTTEAAGKGYFSVNKRFVVSVQLAGPGMLATNTDLAGLDNGGASGPSEAPAPPFEPLPPEETIAPVDPAPPADITPPFEPIPSDGPAPSDAPIPPDEPTPPGEPPLPDESADTADTLFEPFQNGEADNAG